MALDMLDAIDKISGIFLFSGDSTYMILVKGLSCKERRFIFLACVDRSPGSFGTPVQNILISGSGIRALKSENPVPKNRAACIGKSLASLHYKYSTLFAIIKRIFSCLLACLIFTSYWPR